jgi:Uma2 family endonuclease
MIVHSSDFKRSSRQIMVQTPIRASVVATDRLQTYTHRTWEQFKLIQKGLEAVGGVRLFFFDGTVEVLMPGRYHEVFKKIIAILIEAFLIDRKVDLMPTGSMDRELPGVASAQPDESYEIGEFKLLIEVTVTSGTIAKLKLYKALGIHEVWFWEDGVLKLYHLIDAKYQPINRSQIPELATLDINVLTKCILLGETSRLRAVEELRLAHPV